MKKLNALLHLLIIPLFAAELISRWNNFHTLEYLVKPWLMIWIIAFFWLNTRGENRSVFIYLAFIFSWTGDMFLMLAHRNEMLFYAGVGGFFLAQLSYIKHFLNTPAAIKEGYLIKFPAWTIPFILYLVAVLYLILGGMKGMMIPVILVYALSLIVMSMSALNRKELVDKLSFRLVFIGSVLFVISDSLIALNKFYTDIPRASFLIILTYFPAQYLIMQGLIGSNRNT